MGVEFIDETVSGGQRITRRTEACEVCKTVFLSQWPLGTTHCGSCQAPLCVDCVPLHTCPTPDQRLWLERRRREFEERINPRGRNYR